MEEKPKRTRRTKEQMNAFRASLKPEEVKPIESIGVTKENPVQVKSVRSSLYSVEDMEETLKNLEVRDEIGVNLRVVVEGWVNIQTSKSKRGEVGYFCGGDIHPTQESAKRVASANTIGQAFLSLTRK